ncbi:hypothetical protein K3E28_001612 [Escherichia coli]|nr:MULTISPECIES: hypothetical protein [Escherichia]EHW3106906.1 hypothetical protein [Escherichia coli]MBN6313974.1 hypothetical protein [Escherichia coli]MCZ7514792.1 hypothetical protein [Escherichia albertii]MDA5199645.1 hypothetical protein [Escherichia coli]HBB8686017.1 hypothetical protein [Escherichia coli]
MTNRIQNEPAWLALIEQYKDNWELAAKELLDIELTPHQAKIINAIKNTGAKVTATTPHGIGETSIVAVISILQTILYSCSRTVVVSPAINDSRKTIIDYMFRYWERVTQKHPFLCNHFRMHPDKGLVHISETWGCVYITYCLNNEVSLAGFTGPHDLFIVINSAEISDRAHAVITGNLTNYDSRLLLLSKPSEREKGYFYDSHHRLAHSKNNPAGFFTAITLNTEDSPLVSEAYLEFKAKEFGGRNSDEYRRLILGKFPGIRELMEKSSVPRNMHFTMTDGSKWVVPTIVIAKHHAKHHAQKHNSSTLDWLKAYTIPLFSANHNAIAEWAKQIPWRDIAEEAFVEKLPRDMHEHCWLTSEKSFS